MHNGPVGVSSTHHAYHSSQKNLAHFTTHIAWKTWKNLIHLVYSVLSHKPNVHNIKCILKPISSLVIPGLREMLMFNKCMLSSRCQNFVWTKKSKPLQSSIILLLKVLKYWNKKKQMVSEILEQLDFPLARFPFEYLGNINKKHNNSKSNQGHKRF